MLKINCPKCRREIELPEEKLGEVVTCDSCKTYFVTERVLADDQPSAPSGSGYVPEKDAVPLLFSIISGEFKEIERNGKSFPRKTLLRLNRRFCVFTVLFLVQLACMITIINNFIIRDAVSVLPFISVLLVLLTIPLSVVYAMLLRAMQVSRRQLILSLSVFWLVPGLFVVCVARSKFSSIASAVLGILLLIDILLRLSNMFKTAAILREAKDLPFRGNRFVRTMKRYSFLHFPLLVFLLVSVIIFGSVKREIALCANCEVCIDRIVVYYLGAPLLSFSQKTPTRFTGALDPEHQCRHRFKKKTPSSKEEYFFLNPFFRNTEHVITPERNEPPSIIWD